jgi:potassium voltage-gated channel Shab-related subfamily B protein 1
VCRYQKELWDLIEHPDASTAAHIVSYISMMFVVVSTIGMSLNTMPGLKVLIIG